MDAGTWRWVDAWGRTCFGTAGGGTGSENGPWRWCVMLAGEGGGVGDVGGAGGESKSDVGWGVDTISVVGRSSLTRVP